MPTPFPTLTNETLAAALRAATLTAQAASNGQEDAYCGFAQVNVHIRKNHRQHNIFLNNGWKWSDYEKCYYLYMGFFTHSQSMTLKENMARAVVETLREAGVPAYGTSRAD